MRPSKTSIIAAIFVILILSPLAQMIKVKFTKFECELFDEKFATFEMCRLKAMSRSLSVIDVYLKVHKIPVENITLNAELFQKTQGFRPFMYNTTLDFCRLMKNAKSSIFWKMVFNEIIPYSNMNHSCPINHDIIISGLHLRGGMFDMVPFPSSDYMFRLKFAVNKIFRLETRAYVTLYD